MNLNLLESIKAEVTPTFIDKLSNYLKETRNDTSTAVSAAIPTVLAYFTEKSQTQSGAELIYNAATDNTLGVLFENNSFLNAFEQNKHALLAKGNTFIAELFKGKEEALFNGISRHANINEEAASGVFAGIMPLIMKVIGDKIHSNNLSASGLPAVFEAEKEDYYSSIPTSLASLGTILGIKGLSDRPITPVTGHTVANKPIQPLKEHHGAKKVTIEEKEKDSPMKWLLPLLGLIAAGLLVWFLMKSCNKEDNTTVNTTELSAEEYNVYTLNNEDVVVTAEGIALLDAEGKPMKVDGVSHKLNENNFVVDENNTYVYDKEGKAIKIDKDLVIAPATVAGEYDEASGNFIYDTGNALDIELPDGSKMTVGERSTEARLYNFLNDANVVVSDDKTKDWITLDRIYFDLNKATLTPESKTQLDNVANILKNYPNAEIKFGGYTDNQGSPEINQPLSDARAKTAMDYIVNAGIDASRLSSEGYGQAHFLCPENDTPACRAQNRRVDIRVVKK